MFEKNGHKIVWGDVIEVLPSEVSDESINLIFADPPYNMSKKKGLGWKYSKHVTMQEEWDMFSKMIFLNLIKNGLQNV